MPRRRLLTPRFILLGVSGALYFGALSLTISVLPIWVESDLGATSTQVGLSVGIFGVSAAVLRPLVGPLGDRHGRRLLVVAGATIAAVALMTMTIVDTIPLVLAARLLAGVGEAGVFVGLATAIQDLADDDRRGEAASYFSLTIYASLAVAPPVGERIAEAHGTDTVWVLAAALALGAAAAGVVAPGAPAVAPARSGRYYHPAAVRPAAVLFLGLIGYAGFLSFAALHATDVGIANSGTVFTVLAVVVITLRTTLAQVPDRIGPVRTTTIALSVGVVALTILGTWRTVAGMYVGTALIALSQTFLFPALFVLAVDRAPDDERSHAIGSFSMAFDLAFAAGGAFIGLIADATDRPTGFLAAAVVSAVTLAFARGILGDTEVTTKIAVAGPRSRR